MMRDTSRQAWDDLRAKNTVSVRQAQVLAVIRSSKTPITDSEISNLSGLPINCVTGRRGELVEMGLVVDCGKIKNAFGRSVHVWRAVKPQPYQKELFR